MTTATGRDGRSRRGFLRAAAGATALAGVASGTAAAETVTVAVGPDNEFVFTPGTEEPLYITPGTTVEFVWESDTHNIHVDSQPEGAGWEGHETIENTGFTYEHTFETIGEYHYWCVPHKANGMVADIVVNESGEAPGGGGGGGEGGGGGPVVPDSARNLAIGATALGTSALGLGLFFLKFGGDYDEE